MRGVALIVLAWNKWPLTKRCLDSLLATDLDHAEVIAAGNAAAPRLAHLLAGLAARIN